MHFKCTRRTSRHAAASSSAKYFRSRAPLAFRIYYFPLSPVSDAYTHPAKSDRECTFGSRQLNTLSRPIGTKESRLCRRALVILAVTNVYNRKRWGGGGGLVQTRVQLYDESADRGKSRDTCRALYFPCPARARRSPLFPVQATYLLGLRTVTVKT